MKRLFLMAAAMLSFTACIDETTDWNTVGQGTEQMGYIVFGNDAISVTVDREEGEGDVTPQGVRSTTRAVYSDVADYRVEIYNAAGELVVGPFRYGDWNNKEVVEEYVENEKISNNLTLTGIKLPVGSYTVKAYSYPANQAPANAATTPDYVGSTTVNLTKGAATEVNITCHISSVMVTVCFDPILAEVIDAPSTSVLVRLDEESIEEANRSQYTYGNYADKAALVVGHDEVAPTYLTPQSSNDGVPLNLYLTTLYGGEKSQINGQKLPVVSNAKPGEWRKITIKLDHGTEGTVFFVVNVETWVENQRIDVTQAVYAANLAENAIPDISDAPVIKWGDKDLSEPIILDDNMFDSNGSLTGGAPFAITTKQPLEAIYLSASSNNSDLANLISSMGMEAVSTTDATVQYAGVNILGELQTLQKTILKTWGFPLQDVVGKTEAAFDLSGLMEQLQADYQGDHEFVMTVVDDRGNNTTVTLKITSGGVIDPNIWWDGQDINKRHVVTPDLKVKIMMSATKGFKSLVVTVGGRLGQKDGMNAIGLPNSFDLLDPGYMVNPNNPTEFTDEELGPKLQDLGFPVGNEFDGKTEVSFDITTFMGMMGSFKGDTDFTVTLTDNDNNKIERTVKLTIQ